MSEQETPQGSAAGPPVDDSEPAGGESPNRGLMIVLSYLWILFLIPLLLEKDDREVQWHAKNGLVLTVLEILIYLVLNVIVATGIGCLFAIFVPLIFVAFIVIRLLAIMKGLKGERFMVPGVSQYADRF